MTFDRYVALLAVSYSMAVRPFEEQTLLCLGHTHPPSRQSVIRVKYYSNDKGIARTQSPTNKNYALKLPTFGAIVGVNHSEVQWNSLTLGELPC